MDDKQLQELMKEAVDKAYCSMTTDWLSYCLQKSLTYEVLSESVVETIKSIKAGIPAVGTITLIDNDYYQIQCQEWKDEYQLLCHQGMRFCIKKIQDVVYCDEEHVMMATKVIFIQFDDPESVPAIDTTISTPSL
jgi:hypothetical protein